MRSYKGRAGINLGDARCFDGEVSSMVADQQWCGWWCSENVETWQNGVVITEVANETKVQGCRSEVTEVVVCLMSASLRWLWRWFALGCFSFLLLFFLLFLMLKNGFLHNDDGDGALVFSKGHLGWKYQPLLSDVVFINHILLTNILSIKWW